MIHFRLVGITCGGFVFYFFAVNGGRPVPSAPNWFVLVNGLLLVGTLQVMDVRDPVALRFTLVELSGFLSFSLGAGLVNSLFRTTPTRRIVQFVDQPLAFDLRGRPWRAVAIPLLILSLAVCASFAIALGYHVALTQISLASTSAIDDEARRAYSSLRTEVHYGGRYLFIGYVTQFKDYILPTLTGFFWVRAQKLGGGIRWLTVLVLALTNLYLLTITGQRKPVLVFAVVLLLIISSPWSVIQARFRRPGLNRLIVGLVLSVAAAVFVGVAAIRSHDQPDTFGELLVQGLGSFWGRVGPDLAATKIRLAQLLVDRPTSWGGDWLVSLATITPGHGGRGLGNEFHALLYGSESGAAGLMIWQSLWLNFHWGGILFGGLLLGAALQWATLRMWRGDRFASKHVVLVYLSLQLGLFTGPYSLFNGGVFTLCLLYLLYKGMRDRSPSSVSQISATSMPFDLVASERLPSQHP